MILGELKVEAGVSLECRSCGKRSTIPALKVETGIKCDHCGAELTIDAAALAARAVMLAAANGKNDVKID